MSRIRVAVTGIGAISGLGHNVEQIWKNCLAAKSGISRIENQDTTDWPVTFGGEVKNFKISDELLPAKEQSRFDLFIHYALHCAEEAIKQAQLQAADYSPLRIGSILGTGLGGFPIIESTHKTFLEKGARRVSPFFVPSFIPNMSSGKISMKYGFKGANYAVSSACASSGHAIGSAFNEIALGRLDAVVTGGSESVVSPLTMAGFNQMKALSKNNDNPQTASCPFDIKRDGFIMGEGAGILVLENLEKAKARGAKIIAEVVGIGASADAYHITSPHPEGAGTIPCMEQAILDAQVDKSQINYINAHGTSTPLGDIAETNAIKSTFKEHAHKLIVSSTKSSTGHLLGGAAGLESIFCIKAIQENIIPPTINLSDQDPSCDLNYCANTPIKTVVNYALNNSFGFGGTNSTTIFKKYED